MQEKLAGLEDFYGTDNYYFNPLFRAIKYTDGVKYIAEKGKAYWFLDVLFSHAIPKMKSEEFMVGKLTVNNDNSAEFSLQDGDHNVLATQHIDSTDFPARTAEIWIENGVAYLPSER